MSFHNPSILWGLFAILIPIIIHLFNFRKVRKVYFPTLAFLQEIIRKNQRKSDLKHLLVLASRILAIAALVIAFAGPHLKDPLQKLDLSGDRVVSIYLDNSFSMQAGSSFEANFLRAKEHVRRIAGSLPPDTRYQFLSNDMKPGSSLLLSKDDLLEELDELRISSVHKNALDVLSVMQDQMPAGYRDKAVYFIVSDFQHPGVCDLSNVISDSSGQYLFLPVAPGSSVANVSIDSAWFDSPIRQLGSNNELKAVLSNHSGQDLEKVSVRLFIDGVQISAVAIDIPANASSPVSIPVSLKKQGFQTARLEITDYPLVFDDVYEMSWQTLKSKPISHIYADGSGSYLQRLFGPDSSFSMRSFREGQVDYESLRRSDLLIIENLKEISSGLRSELDAFMAAGGSVLVFPPLKGEIESYSAWLAAYGIIISPLDTSRAGIDKINLEHPLLQGVFEKSPDRIDLPAVYKAYPFTTSDPSSRTVLYYRVDRPFLSSTNVGQGQLYFCATALSEESSSLPNHSLFVYLTLNAAIRSGGTGPISYTLEQGLQIPLSKLELQGDEMPLMRRISDGYEFVPEVLRSRDATAITMRQSLPEAGLYELRKADSVLAVFAFNNSRSESASSFADIASLQDWSKTLPLARSFILDTEKLPLDASLKDVREGKSLSFWFIIAALLLLLGEVILLRWL